MISDGLQPESKAYDYYASFAIHYYSLLLASSLEKENPKLAQLYRRRAAMSSLAIVNLFAPDGTSIPFGRSMTYRFATSAFWATCAFDGVQVSQQRINRLMSAPVPFESGCNQGATVTEHPIIHAEEGSLWLRRIVGDRLDLPYTLHVRGALYERLP